MSAYSDKLNISSYANGYSSVNNFSLLVSPFNVDFESSYALVSLYPSVMNKLHELYSLIKFSAVYASTSYVLRIFLARFYASDILISTAP